MYMYLDIYYAVVIYISLVRRLIENVPVVRLVLRTYTNKASRSGFNISEKF